MTLVERRLKLWEAVERLSEVLAETMIDSRRVAVQRAKDDLLYECALLTSDIDEAETGHA